MQEVNGLGYLSGRSLQPLPEERPVESSITDKSSEVPKQS